MSTARIFVGIMVTLLLLAAAGRLVATGWDSTIAWIFTAIMISVSSLAMPKFTRRALAAWRRRRNRRVIPPREPFKI